MSDQPTPPVIGAASPPSDSFSSAPAPDRREARRGPSTLAIVPFHSPPSSVTAHDFGLSSSQGSTTTIDGRIAHYHSQEQTQSQIPSQTQDYSIATPGLASAQPQGGERALKVPKPISYASILGLTGGGFGGGGGGRGVGPNTPEGERPRNSSVSRTRAGSRARERSQLGQGRSEIVDDDERQRIAEEHVDDELRVTDRGEALVRKRQKERQRARKLASTRTGSVDPFAGQSTGGGGGEGGGPETSSSFLTGTGPSLPHTPAMPVIAGQSLGSQYGSASRARSQSRDGRGYFPAYSTSDIEGYGSQYGSSVPGTPAVQPTGRSSAPSLVDEVIDEVVRDAGRDAGGDEDEEDDGGNGDDDDDDGDLSSPAEDGEVTVKDRQDAFNVEHMFGLPVWKPALYKKSRSITRNAEVALHAIPSAAAERNLWPGNVLWTLLFGWWLAAAAAGAGLVVALVELILGVRGGYAKTLLGLGWYIVWPFGKFLEGLWVRKHDEEEDEDEDDGDNPLGGRDGNTSRAQPIATDSDASVVTVRKAQSPERQRLLGQNGKDRRNGNGTTDCYGTVRSSSARNRTTDDARQPVTGGRLIGCGLYYLLLFLVVIPSLLSVCIICWALIFTIPMARLNWALIKYLIRRPLSINFRSPPKNQVESPTAVTQAPRLQPGQIAPTSGPESTVLLCIYRAIGYEYYKYTIGGVNIIFINLVPLIFFTIIDGLYLLPLVEHHHVKNKLLRFLTSEALVFILSLASVIPLSYFIGMAVASISVQSSIGMGAVINATFGSIIEVILYGIALTQGKGRLVEGSIVGSLLAGVLLMPGASMCSGAVRRKEQKFNAKSAGVTSTMLIMAIIGTLTPTLFYQTYGTFQIQCDYCPDGSRAPLSNGSLTSSASEWNLTSTYEQFNATQPRSCNQCYYDHPDPAQDPFYQEQVKDLMYFCASVLLLSYLIGLWFSLRTHASQIWQNPQQLMKHDEVPQGAMHPAHRNATINRLTPQALAAQLLPSHRQQTENGKPPTFPMQPPSAVASPALAPEADQTQTHTQTHTPTPGGKKKASFSSFGDMPNQLNSKLSPPLQPAEHITTEDFTRAVAVATISALRHQASALNATTNGNLNPSTSGTGSGILRKQQGQGLSLGLPSGDKEFAPPGLGLAEEGGHGGHEGPSWSRGTSAAVLLSCTVLYAIIAGELSCWGGDISCSAVY